MYKKVSTDLNFVKRELETLEFWKQNRVFEKSIENREGCEHFTFYDGPPTANGKPHIGHILTRVIKDIIPRYKTMKGYKVLRKAGWDTHGLPVELEVEKMLGLDGKDDIERYGIEPFIKKCKESVWKYKGEWEKMSDRVGFWADMENPYITYDNNYIESEWWALKKIWDMGLLYKGHKVVPYCPRCGTSLSSHEVAQGYKDITDKTIYVKFKVKDTADTYFMAWTTTPWTLPSNVALTVGAKFDYAKVKYNNEYIIVAKQLVPSVFEGSDYEIVSTVKGKELEYMKYEPLFDFVDEDAKKEGFYVCLGDFVTLTDGTGIVHTAPAFGEDDSIIGKKYNLPFLQMVDEAGHMVEQTGFIKGLFVKDADKIIIGDLDKRGLLFKSSEIVHSYPFCWRCDTPLIYYARSTWFIKMTAIRDSLLKNNDKINWMPATIKDGRFGNFLRAVVDWGISRERYWGTPLPIWECECGHREAIGSIAELKEKAVDCPKDIELHKPYIDNVHLKCPKCSAMMKRVAEVIDCWFDSGSMPFAQHHYPFENKQVFEQGFPADFISEALDQTRGWFYTLHAISCLLFDSPAYKNCIVLGLVQDKEGQKMSKHKGNVVDPWDVLENQGADAVRWYFYTVSAPWLPSRFHDKAVTEGQRKFMGTLWNTYAFYVLYAEIDKFNPLKYRMKKDTLCLMDRWILSKLNTLVKNTDKNLVNYRIFEASREIQEFTDQLSNWYVRRSRERYWGSEETQDKINAYLTLYTALVTLAKLAAPFTPFITEQIYGNLVVNLDKSAPISVHLTDYPVCDESLIDKEMENQMEELLKVIVVARSLRNISGIKNRQPLRNLYISSEKKLNQEYIELLKDELNIKDITYVTDASMFIDYSLKPQLRTLGKKYGRLLPAISEHLKSADGAHVMGLFEKGLNYEFTVEGNAVVLEKDDVLSETKEKDGLISQSDNGITVVLDINLDEQLIEEGYVREIVSKIQTMRKDAGYDVTDKITVYIESSDMLEKLVVKNFPSIMKDVLATGIAKAADDSFYCATWDINGVQADIKIKRV
ncbi:MAG TPA: isoleucine--tRNA ligase [Clostridia bacterium]|jgi:isoleucyl-tRNA synthetase|nr:isoleucine--tRNA ligase [Clostridiaceae bacterium]HOF26923.1 isoleucine--tRNA ligase [Clostridia bacterium]HOM34577.1 isoleucine--tRNA ligase [Clostridia bacterium]HOR89935.1 isoleucine--tRNA ligase [Clostridia bacterium]HOT70214.1 isoleucine--tRNA ligase [Clostridia bacterium]